MPRMGTATSEDREGRSRGRSSFPITNTERQVPQMEQPNIVDLYEDGHSIKDISAQLHIHPSDVRSTLHEAGRTNTRAYRNISPAMVRVVNVMLNHHVAYRDIETYCDISFDAVRGCVERSDRRMRGFPRRYEPVGEDDYRFPDFGLFLSRYDRGESFTRVVEDLTLTDNQVYAAFYYLWSTVHLHEHQKNMAERVRAQRKSGFSVAAIAKREHISYAVVRAICRP